MAVKRIVYIGKNGDGRIFNYDIDQAFSITDKKEIVG